MYYVYLVRSTHQPSHRQIGLTENLQDELKRINEPGNDMTAKLRPWDLVGCVSFHSRRRAVEFETYMKTNAGQAFAKRHHMWEMASE